MESITGMQVWMIDGFDMEENWHPEMEVLFVIDGEARLKLQERTILLKKEDVYLINSSQPHAIFCPEGTIICCVKYPWKTVASLMGSSASFFVCNSVEDEQHSYHDLRSIFRELVFYCVRSPHKTSCLLESLTLRLLDCLLEHYLVEPQKEGIGAVSDDIRIQQILQYVNQNYHQSVSLTSIAEEMFVSPSTLSRFFKKRMGCGFVDYLNQIRIRSALSDLIQSDENITKISVNNGFSNLSVFNRLFREQYGLSPTDYRKQYRNHKVCSEKEEEELLEKIKRKLSDEDFHFAAESDAKREQRSQKENRLQIFADGSAGTPYEKNWNQVVNIGAMSQLTQSNLQNHLLHLVKQFGFRYGRIWNIFSDKLLITDGVRIGGYNYNAIDAVLDFMVSNHIRPWLDFGRRPNTINKNELWVIFQEEEYIDFRSRRAWESLVQDFIRHIIFRYGKEEVSLWRFEICYITGADSNDPCYHDTTEPYDFFNAYRFFYKTLREYLPKAELGGFSTIPDWNTAMTRRLMYRCTEEHCIPDFFSIILYPYVPSKSSSNAGSRYYPIPQRTGDRMYEEKMIALSRRLLQEVGWSETRLFACEWNNTLSNRNYLNDSCFRSAIFAQKMVSVWDSVDVFGVLFGSDWLGSHYDTYRVINGNCGFMTQSSIRKPIYFALQFMNMLGGYLVHKGENYIITRTQHKTYYILCFNPKRFNSSYYLMEEHEFMPGQLDSLFEDMEPIDLTITLDHMPEDMTYTVKKRSINSSEGMILHEWSRFQYADRLEGNDVKYLCETCFPRMSMETLSVRNKKLQIRETIRANEVVLLHIYTKM